MQHLLTAANPLLIEDYFRSSSLPATRLSILPTNPTNNDKSVADTIRTMERLSEDDSYSDEVERVVTRLKRGVREERENDNREEILGNAIWRFVRSRVRFANDETILSNVFNLPEDNELLISPQRLLTMSNPIGDCDDYSMLVMALLKGLGIRGRFITIAADSNEPDRLSHVYVEMVTRDGKEIPIDSSHGSYFGWESPKWFRKVKWEKGRKIFDMRNANLFPPDERGVLASRMPMGKGVGRIGGIGRIGRNGQAIGMSGVDGVGEIDWGGIIKSGVETAGSIFKSRYSTPQLSPGQYVQTPGGVTYQLPAGGGTMPTLSTPSVITDNMLPIMLGVGALAVLLMMVKR